MSVSKDVYLDPIRAKSAYPTYRGVIGIITAFGYALAVFDAVGTLTAAFSKMPDSFWSGLVAAVVGLLSAALILLLARFFKEAALILVDIGDSIVDANARSTTDSL